MGPWGGRGTRGKGRCPSYSLGSCYCQSPQTCRRKVQDSLQLPGLGALYPAPGTSPKTSVGSWLGGWDEGWPALLGSHCDHTQQAKPGHPRPRRRNEGSGRGVSAATWQWPRQRPRMVSLTRDCSYVLAPRWWTPLTPRPHLALPVPWKPLDVWPDSKVEASLPSTGLTAERAGPAHMCCPLGEDPFLAPCQHLVAATSKLHWATWV